MGARGRGRGRGKVQNVAPKAPPSSARKRGKSAVKVEVEDDEPPTKLQKEESMNTKLRKAIKETKDNAPKKKVFKPDGELGNYTADTLLKVYEDYSCMLNQTNIGNNNNKYYVIQLVAYGGVFGCFTKWGRVGEPGQHNCDMFIDVDKAIASFKAKFKSKTKNDWDKRDNFTAAKGKYTLLDIDEESESEDETDSRSVVKKEMTSPQVKCSLDDRTALLVKLIFNDDMFVSQMAHMNLDVKKMPLGKLSKSQLAKGLEVLLDIEKALQTRPSQSKLAELSSSFYTLIPHNFGRKVPTVINNQSIIDQKKELMMTLSDIELTQSLQKDKGDESKIHPFDDKYSKLNCQLELLSKNGEEYNMIVKYAKACPNTRKGTVLDIWKADRASEGTRFDLHKDIKHRKLLWHGTNVAVVAAILNSGLRIMPHSGGRVGRGMYFASEHSKSAWYVGIHYGTFEKETNIGFMFLVEVALGKECNISKDDHTLKAAPKGYDSIVARGMTEPDPKQDIKVKLEGRDVVVPLGKPIKNSVYETSNFSQSEYLVYKESQARIRYLLKFSFS